MTIKKNSSNVSIRFESNKKMRSIANKLLDYIDGDGDYEDSYDGINNAMYCKLTDNDYWVIMQYYCNVNTVDLDQALCCFASELWECIDEI